MIRGFEYSLLKNLWKRLAILCLFVAFSFTLGFVSVYHFSQLEDWLRMTIYKKTENLPIQLLPKKVTFDWPLSLVFQEVHVFPNEQVQSIFEEEMVIPEVRLHIQPFRLFWSKPLTVYVRGGHYQTRWIANSDVEPNSEGSFFSEFSLTKLNESLRGMVLPWFTKNDLQPLLGLPIRKIQLNNATQSSVYLSKAKNSFEIFSKNFSLTVNNSGVGAHIRVQSFATAVTAQDVPKNASDGFDVDLSLVLDPTHPSLEIDFVRAPSTLEGVLYVQLDENQSLQHLRFDLEAKMVLSSLTRFLRELFPDSRIIHAEGGVDFQVHYEMDDHVVVKAKGENLHVGSVFSKYIELEGLLDEEQGVPYLRLDSVHMEHISNNLKLQDVQLALRPPFSLEGVILAERLELREFLSQLGIESDAVLLGMEGELPCKGQLQNLRISCKGAVYAKNLFVSTLSKERDKDEEEDFVKTVDRAGPQIETSFLEEVNFPRIETAEGSNKMNRRGRRFEVLQIREGVVRGDVTLTKNAIYLNTHLQIGKTKGFVEGRIHFKRGFRLKYRTNRLFFQDAPVIAGLRFQGDASLYGIVRGNSKTAQFFVDFQTNDFWFEDYGIGDVKSRMQYRRGKLLFSEFVGELGVSKYQGSLAVNLLRQQLEANIESNFLGLEDVAVMLSRRLPLPFMISGLGNMALQVSGPFRFEGLSYNLKSQAKNVKLGKEIFREAVFHVIAKSGEVKIERASLKKEKSQIELTGTGYPDGMIKAQVVGESLLLEESQILADWGLSMLGEGHITAYILGHIKRPNITIAGNIANMFSAEIPLGNSEFEIKTTKDFLELHGHFLDKKLVFTEWNKIPWEREQPMALYIEAKQFDFSPFLSIFGPHLIEREYRSDITGRVRLYSASDWFWNATGDIFIEKFQHQRDDISFQMSEPTTVQFRHGEVYCDKWHLTGNDTDFSVTSNNSKKESLNVKMNGSINIYPLAFLTPFLNEVQGVLSLDSHIRGSAQQISVTGSSFLENGILRVQSFPHSFSHVRIQTTFDQNKIILDEMEAQLTSGIVNGKGTIELKGFRSFPTDIKATITDVNLNIPDGIKTRGSGDIHITGDWFPFKFSGRYNVTQANVDKEIEENGVSGVKKSQFLPSDVIFDFVPFEFDVVALFNENANISNTTVESSMTGRIHILGPVNAPRLRGVMRLSRGGILLIKDTRFEIENAEINFLGESSDINPALYIRANTMVQGYDITLDINGRANPPNFNFNSTPALSQADLINLVMFGRTPSDINAGEVNTQSSASYEIGSSIVSGNLLGRFLKEKTGVELRLSSESIGGTGLDDHRVVPKMIMRYKLLNRLDITASRAFGESASIGANVEYKINNNISIVGSLSNQETEPYSRGTTQKKEGSVFGKDSVLGVDFTYKMSFK